VGVWWACASHDDGGKERGGHDDGGKERANHDDGG